MLKSLLIKNYTLIRHLEIYPSANFNIVTGETGAGKSIMLGALGLLQGERAESKVHFDPDEKCIIEASFDTTNHHLKPLFESLEVDYEPVSILRREIVASGKSRAFINDMPVRLEALRQISDRLMDIHSQYDTSMLASNNFQLSILDSYAQNQAVFDQYLGAYHSFRKAEKIYLELLQESKQINSEHEFNTHQLNELAKANLDQVNLPALEEELEVLENSETIKNSLNLALELLSQSEYSVESSLKSVIGAFSPIEAYAEKFKQLKERLQSTAIEVQDLVLEIEKEESQLFLDPETIEALKEQVDDLYALQKKHKVNSIEALIAVREILQEKVDKVLNFDEELATAKKAKDEGFKKMMAVAEELSASRKAVVEPVATQINLLLKDLGMPNARLEVSLETVDATPLGIDKVSYLFSANKGIAPQELKNVASGGEFSRLMLCIKYLLATKTALPTIIFDEIDTGISGEIAIKMGKMLQEMSTNHQIITISHLPQIAAMGDTHYFVFKDDSEAKTQSKIKKLTQEERVQEIAQMIGGYQPSPVAFQSARELMGLKAQ